MAGGGVIIIDDELCLFVVCFLMFTKSCLFNVFFFYGFYHGIHHHDVFLFKGYGLRRKQKYSKHDNYIYNLLLKYCQYYIIYETGKHSKHDTQFGNKKTLFLYTLPKTNSSPLKMDGWNTILSYWVKRPIFRGKLAVSFREAQIVAFKEPGQEVWKLTRGGWA